MYFMATIVTEQFCIPWETNKLQCTTQTLHTKVCYRVFSSNSSLCLSSLSLHKWEQYFVISGNQAGIFNRKCELKQNAVDQAEIFSEYFCSEAAEVRSRLTKGCREAAHVAWAIPGYRMRCPGLVVSGLDLQHARKAQSWYKVRWAAQQEFLSGRHSSCSTSCWKPGGFQDPSWALWKKGPPLAPA